jgi:hypothetical protein
MATALGQGKHFNDRKRINKFGYERSRNALMIRPTVGSNKKPLPPLTIAIFDKTLAVVNRNNRECQNPWQKAHEPKDAPRSTTRSKKT